MGAETTHRRVEPAGAAPAGAAAPAGRRPGYVAHVGGGGEAAGARRRLSPALTRRWAARAVRCLALLVCLAGVRGGQFHPNKSTSFLNMEQLFKVEYLDDASLTGFVAEDIVQLGDYYVSTRFGCVTTSKGHDWAQADGILGMGFPAAALRSVPFPLFWALTDQTKVPLDNSNILINRVFTLMLSQDRGELVLGGHDPASVKVRRRDSPRPALCATRHLGGKGARAPSGSCRMPPFPRAPPCPVRECAR